MKKCMNCGLKLPDDSEFCQYCGSSEIESIIENNNHEGGTISMFCNDCGKGLPDDSEFCQYCGSKNIIIKNKTIESTANGLYEDSIQKNNLQFVDNATKKHVKNYKTPFIALLILTFIIIGIFMYYYNTINSKLINTQAEYSELVIENQKLLATLEEHQTKINNYDYIVSSAKKSDAILSADELAKDLFDSNYEGSPIYVSKTVLYRPYDTGFLVHMDTNKEYTITANYDSRIVLTSEVRDKGDIYYSVKYSGIGPAIIELSNNLNSHKTIVYCIGRD